jgi:uncharacterized protein YjiS (DUF1127 family)
MRSRLTLDAGRVGIVDAAAAAIRAAVAFARRIEARARRRRQAYAFREELRGLDDNTLRDLGLDRSEIGSVASEMAGLTDATRVRALLSSHLFP